MTKKALVLGAGGFIGSHMVNRLKSEGYWVRGVDLKYPEFSDTTADHFVIADLRSPSMMNEVVGFAGCNRNPHQTYAYKFDSEFDEIYQFAADMGGAGYVFTGAHDADIMHNSATINLNLLHTLSKRKNHCIKSAETVSGYPKVFYSSSACVYPEFNQTDPNNPNCEESSAYPAQPDSEYGWEKLFSERLYLAYYRNYGIHVRIARYHNIYGPEGTWDGGREKAPAAVCRKVIMSDHDIEIWGDGNQTRSFLYIDDCIDATRMLMQSDIIGPINIGSEEMVTINELANIAESIDDKVLIRKYDKTKPQGVRGRNSDNKLIEVLLGWKPKVSLKSGILRTYWWIKDQISAKNF